MLPVNSLRPALIFVFITCNREQSNKEIYKYLEEKTKNIVSGWTQRDEILGQFESKGQNTGCFF